MRRIRDTLRMRTEVQRTWEKFTETATITTILIIIILIIILLCIVWRRTLKAASEKGETYHSAPATENRFTHLFQNRRDIGHNVTEDTESPESERTREMGDKVWVLCFAQTDNDRRNNISQQQTKIVKICRLTYDTNTIYIHTYIYILYCGIYMYKKSAINSFFQAILIWKGKHRMEIGNARSSQHIICTRNDRENGYGNVGQT